MVDHTHPTSVGTLAQEELATTVDAHTIMINRVSWGAIFAGVAVALVVQMLLTFWG